jgi:hypothetical protein
LLVKADLGWVGGHPTGIVNATSLAWRIPASRGRAAREVPLDRASLQRATRALRELELRYADVLEGIVEDSSAWMQGARALLGLLKPLFSGAPLQPPPSDAPLSTGLVRASLAGAIRSAPVLLRSALEAAAWIALVDPPRLGRIVSYGLANERVAATLRASLPAATAQGVLLHLCLLAEADGSKRVDPLARLLANRTLYDNATTGTDYARAVARELRGKRATRPRATLGPSLASWTMQLLTAEARARRGTLELLGVLELAPAAHEWSSWWSRLSRCERLTQREPEPELDARLRHKATRLADESPRSLHGETLVHVLERTLAWDEATQREATRALRELPAFEGGVPVRLSFLEQWDSLATDAWPKGATLATVLSPLRRYLARTSPQGPRRLQPWSRLVDRRRRPGAWSGAPEEALVESVPPPRWPVFYEALALSVEDGNADPAEVCRALLAVVRRVADAGHARALALAIVPHGGAGRAQDRIDIAFDLCGHDPALFGRAVEALGKGDDANLLRALTAVRKTAGDDLARGALLHDAEQLVALGRVLAVLALVGDDKELGAVRSARVDPPWIHEYPAWATPSLRRLSESDISHAERLARRLLGDEVRATAVIRRELVHLEGLAGRPGGVSDRMRRRIGNLRTRLSAPRQPTASVREHLIAKIEAAARRARLAAIGKALDAEMRSRLPTFLGLDDAPNWLFTSRTLAQLAPVQKFDAPMRALAVRVLRMRAGPPPWDLRDDPANRMFLERLARAGIDTNPWVDPAGSTVVTTAKGETLQLRLEDDPLEILDMGRHFSTCLTPGDINYFSTFANVADINKRVLFARSPEAQAQAQGGRVLGRCLLALTAAGGIVVFNRYAHDATLGFGEIVTAFVRDLAERMRTMVVPSGDVPRLVAPDWYDDGPVDLGGRFPFLHDGSEFRLSLATVAATTFLEQTRRLFAPLTLGALTLPLLVALPEMDARPDLLVPLLPALVAAEGVPLATIGRAAILFAKTPEAAVAARALVPRIVARLRDAAEDDQGWVEGAAASVVATCPVDTLRLLRATRARRVHSWADEHDHRRLEMAARAYDVLRRPRLAAQLYRYAASRAWSASIRRALEARAAVLEATLRRP